MTSPPGTDLGPFASLAKDLQDITGALAAAGTEREVIEIVLTPAVKALGAVAGIVLLVDRTDQQIKIAGSQGYEDGAPTLWQEGPIENHVLIADILRMKEARYFEDVGALKDAYPELESRTGGLAAIANATLPMFLDDQPLGVIVLDFKEPHHFTEAERRFLTILASQCAVAMGRAEVRRTLEARVEDRTRQLEQEQAALAAFVAFTEAVGTQTGLPTLAREAIRVLLERFPGASSIYYEEENTLWKGRVWSENLRPELIEVISAGIPGETPIFAQVTQTRQAVFTDGWDPEREWAASSEDYHAAANYPLVIGGELHSVLSIGLRETHTWSEADKALFRAVGRSLNLALDRAQQTRTVMAQRDALEARTRELVASNEELEAFTYSVSHDLRTPVRHIISFGELLRRSLPEGLDARTERYFGIVSKAAVTLDTLLDGMLEVSRASRQPLKAERVDLNRVFSNARQEVEVNQPQRQVDWRISALPTVTGDAELLRRVVTALVDNAVKYTRDREGAVIEVWAEDRGPGWAVRVRDNGVGFNPQYTDKLFTMFQRLHRQEDFEGAAVSLANARRIVTRHGGTMLAEGQPGAGATFGFVLPKPAPS